jgi:hypothetical protein
MITLWIILKTARVEIVATIVRLNILKVETEVKAVKNFRALGNAELCTVECDSGNLKSKESMRELFAL